jgi:hypothetical protein
VAAGETGDGSDQQKGTEVGHGRSVYGAG